jgi:Flp pilus assembly protein TadG
MKQLLKSKHGSVSLMFFGIALALLLLSFLIIEVGGAYESYDYAMDVLQRSCNSAVEGNIMDEYRADGILRLDTEKAKEDFSRFVSSDLPSRYSISAYNISATDAPPSMTVTGVIRFPTLLSQFGFEELSFSFKVRATNYDLN